jgi:hypothetical protein
MSEDEFSEGVVEGKAVDTIAGGEDQVGAGRVHAWIQKCSLLEMIQYPAQTMSVPGFRT